MTTNGIENTLVGGFAPRHEIAVFGDDVSFAQSVWESLVVSSLGDEIPRPAFAALSEMDGGAGAHVLIPSPAGFDRSVEVAGQVLWNAQSPCVLIVPDGVVLGEAAGEVLGSSDVAWVAASDGDAAVSAVIRALWMFGRKARDLRDQLSIADRLSQGMTGEMDRVQEEMQLAATVQRESLPAEMPVSETIDIVPMYRPQGFLSGDTYDALRLDDRTLGVFLADAVGHGAPAALLTMVLARSLQTHGRRGDAKAYLDAGHAIKRLNGSMMQRRAKGSIRFATAAYLTIDELTGEVAYASAGHPHGLVYDGGGLVREVESLGAMLGVFEGAEFPESKTVLSAGETLVIHSDGFEQVFGDAETEGDQRGYRDAFRCLGSPSDVGLDSRMQVFMKTLDERAGSLHQVDDLTLVAISRKAAL